MIALRVNPLGDSALTIELGQQRSPELLRDIQAVATQMRNAKLEHVLDVVPAYLSLTVFYDPLQQSFGEISQRVLGLLAERASQSSAHPSAQHVIRVRYDGVDLESVAAATSLKVADVAAIHSGRTYTVDLLGFVPGFAYLSELDPRLQIPRRPQPRPRVAAGSVAIAATQTAVYPLDTPGGWHIIGHTDTVMFDARHDRPALLRAGDTVRFEIAP